MQEGRSRSSARYLVVGPRSHGVVVHALRLAAADGCLQQALTRLEGASGDVPAGLVEAVPAGSTALVHFTDRLFGPTPERAVDVLETLASRAQLALVLHDVPQPAEGADWYARRRAAYARLAGLGTPLVVASRSEVDLLVAAVGSEDRSSVRRRTTVVPLPVERPPARSWEVGPQPHQATRSSVDLAVLGFLYPGKGLEDAIDVAAALSTTKRPVTVTNYGAAADGHADHAVELERYAAACGVAFRVTGYLSDDALHAAVVGADVPLAPHRHISASGSVNTWLEAGRRPVVRCSPYVAELATRLPGTLTATDDLRSAVAAALATPSTTWLTADIVVGPSWAAAAAAHVDVLLALA